MMSVEKEKHGITMHLLPNKHGICPKKIALPTFYKCTFQSKQILMDKMMFAPFTI